MIFFFREIAKSARISWLTDIRDGFQRAFRSKGTPRQSETVDDIEIGQVNVSFCLSPYPDYHSARTIRLKFRQIL